MTNDKTVNCYLIMGYKTLLLFCYKKEGKKEKIKSEVEGRSSANFTLYCFVFLFSFFRGRERGRDGVLILKERNCYPFYFQSYYKFATHIIIHIVLIKRLYCSKYFFFFFHFRILELVIK